MSDDVQWVCEVCKHKECNETDTKRICCKCGWFIKK
jgi:hypothetical protein